MNKVVRRKLHQLANIMLRMNADIDSKQVFNELHIQFLTDQIQDLYNHLDKVTDQNIQLTKMVNALYIIVGILLFLWLALVGFITYLVFL